MNNKQKNNLNRAPTSFIKEFSKNMEELKSKSATDVKNAVGAMSILFEAAQNAKNTLQASKSPEQIVKEQTDTNEADLRAICQREEKKHSKLDLLFKEWLKRDTWLIYQEAIPLTNGESPNEILFYDEKLWKLVESCAGHSLKIANLDLKAKQWRVKPDEWVRWLKEKEQPVNIQLESQLLPKVTSSVTSKIFKATISRSLMKVARQSALKTFIRQIEELTKKQNLEWNSQEIPVTKRDFLEVFYKENTAIKKISRDSFDRDIADIKIKFKKGTKNNKNNVLIKLFKVE